MELCRGFTIPSCTVWFFQLVSLYSQVQHTVILPFSKCMLILCVANFPLWVWNQWIWERMCLENQNTRNPSSVFFFHTVCARVGGCFECINVQVQVVVFVFMCVCVCVVSCVNLIWWLLFFFQLGCCGVHRFKDWEANIYFNCTSPGVEACGVPFSCCKHSDVSIHFFPSPASHCESVHIQTCCCCQTWGQTCCC